MVGRFMLLCGGRGTDRDIEVEGDPPGLELFEGCDNEPALCGGRGT
jgi:hypothetical protein